MVTASKRFRSNLSVKQYLCTKPQSLVDDSSIIIIVIILYFFLVLLLVVGWRRVVCGFLAPCVVRGM